MEWWLASAPEANSYQVETTFNADTLKSELERINTNLSNAEFTLRDGNIQQLKEALIELDRLLIELRYSQMDLVFSEIYLKHPEYRGQLSPDLLRLQVTIARLGNLLRQERLDMETILGCLSDIHDKIQTFLAEIS